jgi:RNA polymerase sigma factor (TIGR02999 family)
MRARIRCEYCRRREKKFAAPPHKWRPAQTYGKFRILPFHRPNNAEIKSFRRQVRMFPPTTHEVTQLLRAWSDGDRQALDRLVPLVEAELHRLAQIYLRREQAGHTLQTSDLVNETYLRLIDWKNAQWESRAQFFGVAAGLMRRVLVDHARRRNYQKRGGDAIRVSLAEAEGVNAGRDADIVALNDALRDLAKLDKRRGRIVEMKFFVGLDVEEIAEALAVSPRTVAREWEMARAWLFRQLSAQ